MFSGILTLLCSLLGCSEAPASGSALEHCVARGLRVAGVLVDESGGPVARAAVFAGPAGQGHSVEARTSDDGKFVLEIARPGPLVLAAAPQGATSPVVIWEGPVTGDAACTARLGEISVAATWPVAGLVAAEDGVPIAGARVFLLSLNRPVERSGSGLPRAPGSEETDERGRFVLSARFAEGPFAIEVWEEGYEALRSEIATGDTDPQHLTLHRVRSLTLVVVDELGTPIEGAVVAQRFPWLLTGGGGVMPHRTTNADGEVRMLVPARCDEAPSVDVSAGGFAGRSVSLAAPCATEQASVRVELRPEVELRGRIIDEQTGAPVPHATLAIRIDAPDATTVFETADREGHFEMTGVPAGFARLVAERKGFSRREWSQWISEGGELVVGLRRLEAVPVAGRLVTAGGEPLAGVEVTLASRAAGGQAALTDGAGAFRVEGVPAGDYSLVVGVGAWSVENYGTIHVVVEDGQAMDLGEVVVTPRCFIRVAVARKPGRADTWSIVAKPATGIAGVPPAPVWYRAGNAPVLLGPIGQGDWTVEAQDRETVAASTTVSCGTRPHPIDTTLIPSEN